MILRWQEKKLSKAEYIKFDEMNFYKARVKFFFNKRKGFYYFVPITIKCPANNLLKDLLYRCFDILEISLL